jgi:hypothetical protein
MDWLGGLESAEGQVPYGDNGCRPGRRGASSLDIRDVPLVDLDEAFSFLAGGHA